MRTADVCVQCGETRAAIKDKKLYCASMSMTESGPEVDYEWSRHRFKPFSEKELAGQRADEEAYLKQMGDFADFVKAQDGPPTS
jgi:hypothetical protein